MIKIVVTPMNGDQRYAARVEGETLGTFREPFLSAARVLQQRGVPDETPIGMLREGNERLSLTSTVGHAAALTVREGDQGGPDHRGSDDG